MYSTTALVNNTMSSVSSCSQLKGAAAVTRESMHHFQMDHLFSASILGTDAISPTTATLKGPTNLISACNNDEVILEAVVGGRVENRRVGFFVVIFLPRRTKKSRQYGEPHSLFPVSQHTFEIDSISKSL